VFFDGGHFESSNMATPLKIGAEYAEQGLCETVERPSVCLFHRWTAGTAAGGFAAVRPLGRRYQSTAADTGAASQL